MYAIGRFIGSHLLASAIALSCAAFIASVAVPFLRPAPIDPNDWRAPQNVPQPAAQWQAPVDPGVVTRAHVAQRQYEQNSPVALFERVGK